MKKHKFGQKEKLLFSHKIHDFSQVVHYQKLKSFRHFWHTHCEYIQRPQRSADVNVNADYILACYT